MEYLIYQSTACIPRASCEHDNILISSYQCNKRDLITGFLHREADNFVQYLEGPLTALNTTYERIQNDWRHQSLTILDRGRLQRRRLPDWQMGFVDQGTIAISDLLEITDGTLEIKSIDPFDLVVLMVSNADFLRELTVAE